MPTRSDIARAALGTAVVLLVIGGFVSAMFLESALLLLFASLVLALALDPLVGWLARHGVSRRYGSLALHVGILAIVAAATFFVVPVAARQAGALEAQLPQLAMRTRDWLGGSSNALLRHFATLIPAVSSPSATEKLLSGAVTVVAQLGAGVLGTLLVLVVSHAWVVEGEAMVRAATLHLSIEQRQRVRELYDTIRHRLGGYMRAQLMVGASSAMVSGGCYLALGLPYALVLALCTGVGELVPVVGPLVAGSLATVVTLSVAPGKTLWVVLFVVGNHLLQGYVLMPRLAGRAVGVSPLVVLLSLSAFGSWLGLAGAVLAIPIAALLQLVVDRALLRPRLVNDATAGRDHQSVLRLRLRELVDDARRVSRERSAAPGDDGFSQQAEAIAADVARVLSEEEEEAA